MDDIALWNKALSDKEVKDAVYRVFGGTEEGLVTYYSFNHDKGEVAQDATGKHQGKLIGNPTWNEAVSKPLVTVNNCF